MWLQKYTTTNVKPSNLSINYIYKCYTKWTQFSLTFYYEGIYDGTAWYSLFRDRTQGGWVNELHRSKLTRYRKRKSLFFDASIGVLNSLIQIRFAIGIPTYVEASVDLRSNYKFQCTSLLLFESH